MLLDDFKREFECKINGFSKNELRLVANALLSDRKKIYAKGVDVSDIISEGLARELFANISRGSDPFLESYQSKTFLDRIIVLFKWINENTDNGLSDSCSTSNTKATQQESNDIKAMLHDAQTQGRKAIEAAAAAETRAAAAERERDDLRERQTETEQQTAHDAPNVRSAVQIARHATKKAETLAAALYLLAANPSDYRDGTGRVIAARLAQAVNDMAHRWWPDGATPLSIKTMSEHIARALTYSRVIDEDS